MDPDFIERLQMFNLTEEEGEAITVHSDHREKILEEWSLILIGRFNTAKPINFQAAKNLLRGVLTFGQHLKITDVGKGLIQFKFSLESQLVWVMNNGPWSFDNHLLLLRRWEKGVMAFSVNFLHIPIWVQVWGLPFDLINEETGKDIGSGIGRVVAVDCKAITFDQACFLRIQVEMPLDKPIQRGALVISPEGDRVWVAFRYKCLLGLYFNCGFLGHESKACMKEKIRDGRDSSYGDWLRAGYRKPNVNNNRNRPPSPLRRNMEENDGNQYTNPSPQPPHNSEPGTSQDNIDNHATVIENIEQHVTAFTCMCKIEAQFPNPSDGSFLNRDAMDLNCESGIEKDPEIIGDSLISVPILYEKQSLDENMPPASEALDELELNSLSRDKQQQGKPQIHKWRKIKNPKVTSKVETKHATSGVGNKRRKNLEPNEDKKRAKVWNDSSTCTTAEAEIQLR